MSKTPENRIKSSELIERIMELENSEADIVVWKKLCGEFEAQRNELEEHNEELEAERNKLKHRCDHCGAFIIDNCGRCGAPQCCPQCCRITSLETERDKLREACRAVIDAIKCDMNSGRLVSVRVGVAVDKAKEALGHD